ncbi:helix-turn-helix domain-containing protein [Novosphingobium sp. M1R2S20]|uniref:Helix-turn-helix domain-containing protein n=1 Tax=Novosphingobium rhizovicinum TaxID=3228928 RepID=A0ABV3RBR8_9SPHN
MRFITLPQQAGRHLALRVKRPHERRSLSRSATRALDVLEVFGQLRRPLRAVEIARMIDVTPSTMNQLLKTMVDSAHLLFDAQTKTYAPSPRLAAVAAWIAETYEVGGSLSSLLSDVSATSGLVATVTTPNDLFMQIIDLAGPAGAGGERGLQISLFGSAIGSAFLSTLSDAEVRRLAIRARIPESELAGILSVLEEIRQAGHAAGPTTGSPLWSLAIPLPSSVLRGRAVLGIAGPAEEIEARADFYCATLRSAVETWIKPAEPASEMPA